MPTGELAACTHCGNRFAKVQKTQKLCSQPCKVRYYNDRRGHERIGTTITCRECGQQEVKRHRRQFYCESCSQLSARDYLPSQRARVIAYQSARNKRRRAEIPSVSIHERMSAGIKNSICDGKNGRSWEALVGFTVTELMAHLEKQFLPGMTWANRGAWHIDHRRPLCSFEFHTPDCPQFREAWALTNLRPLWAEDNLRKGGRIDLLI